MKPPRRRNLICLKISFMVSKSNNEPGKDKTRVLDRHRSFVSYHVNIQK